MIAQSVRVGHTTLSGVLFETGFDVVDGRYVRWCQVNGERVSEEVFEARIVAANRKGRVLAWIAGVATFLAGYILGHIR